MFTIYENYFFLSTVLWLLVRKPIQYGFLFEYSEKSICRKLRPSSLTPQNSHQYTASTTKWIWNLIFSFKYFHPRESTSGNVEITINIKQESLQQLQSSVTCIILFSLVYNLSTLLSLNIFLALYILIACNTVVE